MKYFIIETEMTNNPIPHITDWFKQINPRDLTLERAGNLPEWTLLNMDNGGEAIFPDILSTPGYLISDTVQGLLKLYDPYVHLKRVVLLDKVARVSQMYFLPILPPCDCLLPESELSRNKSRVIHGIIDLEKAGRRPMIRLGGVTTTHIAYRLDLTESLLRRGGKGIKLNELEVKGA